MFPRFTSDQVSALLAELPIPESQMTISDLWAADRAMVDHCLTHDRTDPVYPTHPAIKRVWAWLQLFGIIKPHGQGFWVPSEVYYEGARIHESIRIPSQNDFALLWYYHWHGYTRGRSRLWRIVCRRAMSKDGFVQSVTDGILVSAGDLTAYAYDFGEPADSLSQRLSNSVNRIIGTYASGLFSALDLYPPGGEGDPGSLGVPKSLPKRYVIMSLIDAITAYDGDPSIGDVLASPNGPLITFGVSPEIFKAIANRIHAHTVLDDWGNVFYSAYVLYCHNDVFHKTHHYSSLFSDPSLDVYKLLSLRHHYWQWSFEKQMVDTDDHEPGDYWDNREYPSGRRCVVPEYEYW